MSESSISPLGAHRFQRQQGRRNVLEATIASHHLPKDSVTAFPPPEIWTAFAPQARARLEAQREYWETALEAFQAFRARAGRFVCVRECEDKSIGQVHRDAIARWGPRRLLWKTIPAVEWPSGLSKRRLRPKQIYILKGPNNGCET